MYKLVCVDMDGTLLNSNKTVSSFTKDVIHKASESGVQVVICTGRLYASAIYYQELIDSKDVVITSNGAYIRDTAKNKVIYESRFRVETLDKITSVLREYGIVPELHTFDSVVSEQSGLSTKFYKNINNKMSKEKRINLKNVESMRNYYLDDNNHVLKCIGMDNDLDKIKRVKNELRRMPEIEVVSSNVNNVEIMNKGVSKGQGVKILSEYLNINKDEVVCIGDNENDLSMIQYAGYGVAMGNGDEYIKKEANYITDTNDNDGVAKVILKILGR